LPTEKRSPRQAGMLTPAQLRAARALVGWSREKLAEKAGVAAETVKRFEFRGSNPKLGTVNKWRRALEERPAAAAAWLNRCSANALRIPSSRARQAAQNSRLLRSPWGELATKRARGSMSPPLASSTNGGVGRGGGFRIVVSHIGRGGTSASKGETSQMYCPPGPASDFIVQDGATRM